ncbi:NTF2 fold immunity protein [Pasteurellaceae bacterium LIM206]|nr:NTF2 fold immunity protein [Pasteurellaceae bacterium LIM206]
MNDISLAKDTLLRFMQEMYSWERKATKNLRSQEYKDMLRSELSNIFERFCTSKKTLRSREKSLSVRFPLEYKLETHPIVNQEDEGKYTFFYIKEDRSGLENLYRFRMIFKNKEWRIDKKEWFDNGNWVSYPL